MPTLLNVLRWQLFSGRKKDNPNALWGEAWHVKNWPDYVARSFVKNPEDLLEELRQIVADKSTPEMKATTKRGGKVYKYSGAN